MRSAAILGAGIALFLTLALTSARGKSSTFDECAHLPAAYTHLVLRDFRLTPDHPPLAKLVAAAPLLFTDVRMRHDDEAWRLRRQWEFGKRFLYRWNDADRLFFRTRAAIAALACVLAAGVFAWTRRHWGLPAASLALLLCVLSPDVLAHGQIVSTDLGAALFIFLAVAAFERATERATWGRVIAAGAAFGAALATKYSALVLLPVLGALAAGSVFWSEPMRMALARVRTVTPAPGDRRRRLLDVLVVLAIMVLAAWLVIWAAYLFQPSFSADPEVNASFEWERVRPDNPLFAEPILLARRLTLLPDPYLFGFFRFVKHSEARASFLMGERSEVGHWYYFPATFALKTPVGLMVLLAIALATRRRHAVPWRVECFLWLPVAIYLALTLTRGLNIGHRHLLPIYPFLFVAAGRCAMLVRGWRPLPVVVVAAAAWYARVGRARAPALPRVLQRARGRARERLPAAGGLEPRLGPGPQGAPGLAARARHRARQAVVLRDRRSRVLPRSRRPAARLHAAAPARGDPQRRAGRRGGRQRHQPGGDLRGARRAPADVAPARPPTDRTRGILDPRLPRRFQVAMTSRLRHLLAHAGLAGSSVVVGLTLLEVGLRLGGVCPRRIPNTARLRDGRGRLRLDCYPDNPLQTFDVDLRDEAVRARYRAAGVARVDAVASRAPFAVEFRFNSLGFRDVEWQEKRPGVHRVIVLGDSFTEGWGVREPDTYPRALERLLDAEEPGRWEVRNAGRRGADFPALADMFVEALAFHPDLLVYGMVPNDVERSPEIDARQDYMNDWILDQAHLSSRPLPPTHWRLLALIEDRLAAWRIDRASTAWYHDLYREPNAAGWNRTRERLRELDARVRAQGSHFLVATWPLLVGLDGRYPFQEEHDLVARFCAEAGIARHDLLPVLRARPNRDLIVHDADRHPSATAHRLVAESLAPVVRSMVGAGTAAHDAQGTSQQARSAMQSAASRTPIQAASRAASSRSPRAPGSARAISGTPIRPTSPRTVPERRRAASATKNASRKREGGCVGAPPIRSDADAPRWARPGRARSRSGSNAARARSSAAPCTPRGGTRARCAPRRAARGPARP